MTQGSAKPQAAERLARLRRKMADTGTDLVALEIGRASWRERVLVKV